MNLPAAFTRKITKAFGDQGRAWLAEVPHRLDLCRQKWGLTHLSLPAELSYNLICFAESPVYGNVALKLGVPHPELFAEMKALSLFAGRGICACHDADTGLGALLLERIVPGTDLTTIQPGEARFRIAAGLMGALPIAPSDDHGLPSYADWISRAFQRVRQENRAGAELLQLVDIAERLFFAQINAPDRPQLLLHGDLHHKNILQHRSGGWKAIDPKGVIGVHSLEAARFMQNEFGMGDRADRLDRLDQMVSIFAERLGEPKQLLAMCAFVDKVLSTCWSLEEGLTPAALQTAVEACTALLGYCRRQTP